MSGADDRPRESFTAMRHEWWPSIAGMLTGEWSREAVMMDLRWHATEARVYRRPFPSRSVLVARWGWTDKRVRLMLASGEWQDPFAPATVAELRGDKGQPRAKQGPSKGQDGANHERSNADDSTERASEGPAEGQARASEGPHARDLTGYTSLGTGVQEGKREREGTSLTTPPTSDPAGSVPPADLTSAMEASDAPTTDPTPEHVNETDAGDRAEEGDVPRVASGSTVGLFGAKWAAALTPEVVLEPAPVVVAPTPPPPTEPLPEKPKRTKKGRPPVDENDPLVPLWTALVAFTPAPGAWRLNGERRAMLAERVAEHGPEVVARVAEWVRTSPHDRAQFLRERGDPMTLLRKSRFDTYAAMSAGPVPKINGANGKPPARRGMLAIEAFMDDDDPGPVTPDRIVIDTTWS